jgi:hypothetical protein
MERVHLKSSSLALTEETCQHVHSPMATWLFVPWSDGAFTDSVGDLLGDRLPSAPSADDAEAGGRTATGLASSTDGAPANVRSARGTTHAREIASSRGL